MITRGLLCLRLFVMASQTYLHPVHLLGEGYVGLFVKYNVSDLTKRKSWTAILLNKKDNQTPRWKSPRWCHRVGSGRDDQGAVFGGLCHCQPCEKRRGHEEAGCGRGHRFAGDASENQWDDQNRWILERWRPRQSQGDEDPGPHCWSGKLRQRHRLTGLRWIHKLKKEVVVISIVHWEEKKNKCTIRIVGLLGKVQEVSGVVLERVIFLGEKE